MAEKGLAVSWLARMLKALEAERAGDVLNTLAASRAVVIGTRQNEGSPICKVIILTTLNICIVILVAGLN